jgi:hypothetical protein
MLKRAAIVSAVLLRWAGGADAASLTPEPVLTAPTWAGSQFVQADRAGRVSVFRGDTLSVYPLTKEGTLGEPVKLQRTPGSESEMPLRAALSPMGDRWLVYSPFSVRLFVEGEEKPLPDLDWNPWAVGFLRDTPVVAVIPRPNHRNRDFSKPVDVPWFVTLAGDRWSPLTTLKGVSVGKLMKGGGMNGVIAENAVFLKADHEGKLWAARQYSYRLQRFSPTGHVLTELTVEGGKVQDKKQGGSQGVAIKLHGTGENPTEAMHDAREEKATSYSFTAERVLLDLTEGLDGRLYLLVHLPDGAMALDRFDPIGAVLERVTLQWKASGTFTMAAGRDALYIAAFSGQAGRWRLSWESLAQARWLPVHGAEIDGGVMAQASR